jgi:hypothetical protein
MQLLKLAGTVQWCLAIKSEANKGAQSRRGSKSKSKLSPNLVSETSIDEAISQREHLVSMLKKIDEEIKKSTFVAEPKGKSMVEQKKLSLEPKSEGKNLINGSCSFFQLCTEIFLFLFYLCNMKPVLQTN